MTNSVNDKILAQVIEGNRELAATDVRNALSRGVDVQWVVPAELAEVLDGTEFMNAVTENVISRVAEKSLNWWKRWILINPARIFKYNLNNLSGDLDIVLSYDPKILKFAKDAIKDTWAFHYNKPMSEAKKRHLDLALRNGAMGSGMTVHDIPDIGDTPQLRKLTQALQGDNDNALKYIERFWQGSKNFTTWRENVLRLAAYNYFLARVRNGDRVYGASDAAKVDATTDIHRKAALLARELIGDYGGLSKGGQFLRRKMIPFYSWLEINAPRYYRMFKNLAVEGASARGRQARTGAVLGKKALFLTAKMSMLYAAAQLFNHIFWPDEEEELGDIGRRQLHLILGRRADGSIIMVRFQGALSDALSWFNLHDFPEDIKELATGKKSIYQWVGEAPLETVNKLVQGVRPDIKIPMELATGRQLFPEFWRPRPIRDKWEHVSRLFSAEHLYRRVAGKPIRGDSVAGRVLNDLANVFSYTADPGETAYHETRTLIRDFLKTENIERPLTDPTTRANALYYYKQAIKFGDTPAAEKYLNKYKELGGKMKYLQVSIKRAHPTANLPARFRSKFFNRLSEKDRKTIKRATAWYKSTYKGAKK
jgi:hypothetical protein